MRPTLLIDEADSFMDEQSQLRNVLNSGHNKDWFAIRNAGTGDSNFEAKTFSTWAPKAVARIGGAHPTLESRLNPHRTATDAPGRKIKSLDEDAAKQRLKPASAPQAARWAADDAEELSAARLTCLSLFGRALITGNHYLPLPMWPVATGQLRQGAWLRNAPDEGASRHWHQLLEDIKAIFDFRRDKISSSA